MVTDTDASDDADDAKRSSAVRSVQRTPGAELRGAAGPPLTDRPRWRIATVGQQRASTSPTATVERPRPTGTPGLLTDRVLVQTSAGVQLHAVLPYIDQKTSGLVLSRGRMTNRTNLRTLIDALSARGFDAPVVFDPEGYRHHVATVGAPFHFGQDGMFAETIDDNLSQQRALGVDVALTPTGLIRRDNVDALRAAAAQANQLRRDDFIFAAPLDAAILDDSILTTHVWEILKSLTAPIAFILAGQLNPLDTNAEARITALRTFAAGPAHVAAFRTDFNGLDLLCHGGFTAAIGTGGSMRHAIDPHQRATSIDPEDQSPSVLYERLANWWRGSRIAREHGRIPAPVCGCAVCDGQRLDRFLSRDDSDSARAHGVVIWQQWSKLILEQETRDNRAQFWKTFCRSRIDEHALLSDQLRRAKPLTVGQAFKAWANLPA